MVLNIIFLYLLQKIIIVYVGTEPGGKFPGHDT